MNIRYINKEDIVNTVRDLCIDAAINLPEDVFESLDISSKKETSALCKSIFEELKENAKIAKQDSIPICQDTGLAIVFVEIGQDVHMNFNIYDAINEGVAKGYDEGYLRKSVVKHPLDRVNTNDNTPAIIHLSLVSGDKIKLTVAPKGGGSENMSKVSVFPPALGEKGVIDFATDVVKSAGSNPCPPIILGVGIGGSIEIAALLSKKALLRKIGSKNSNSIDNELEKKILNAVNNTKIGAGGYGGDITALAVFVESYPCHIASLPIAITIQCHAARHKERVI